MLVPTGGGCACAGVIQWATGNVGQHAVAAIHGTPTSSWSVPLVYSDAKAGRDVGELAGIGRPASMPPRPRRHARPRRRLHPVRPQGENEPGGPARRHLQPPRQRARTSCRPRYRAHLPEETAGRRRRTTRGSLRAGQTFLPRDRHRARLGGRGPAAHHVGILRRIDSILVQELMDYAPTPSPRCSSTSWASGTHPTDVPLADPELVGTTFRAPLLLVADGSAHDRAEFAYRARSPWPRAGTAKAAGDGRHRLGLAARLTPSSAGAKPSPSSTSPA